jgi:hypothetical protein
MSTSTKARRLTARDVTATHEPPDGWWIDLPFGWVMDDGSHGIAEDTKRAALAKLSLAVPCDCDRCNPSREVDVASHTTQERPTAVRDRHGAPVEPVRWEHWPEAEGR